MVRTQIRLTEEQARRLRIVASERGVSIAAVIRDILDRHLTSAERGLSARARMIASAGGFHSGRRDVAERHDDYLADAFGRLPPARQGA